MFRGGQQWIQEPDGTLLNPQSNLCLTDQGAGSTNGTRLDIETCTSSASQQFGYYDTVSLAPGQGVSFRATSACCTGSYIRHRDGQAITSTITGTNSSGDKQDATWFIRPGLADESCLSFESKNFPNGYLRQSNGQVYQQQNDTSAQFASDATFCAVPGHNGQGVSLSSYTNPALFLRHYYGTVYIASNGGPHAWDTPASWSDDTSWLPTPPWSVDSTAPAVTTALSPATANGANGWYVSSVAVTATATDDTDSDPIVQIQVDSGSWTTVTDPVNVATDGSHAILVRATDAAHNTSPAQTTVVKIDGTAPTSVATVDNTARTVTLTAADQTSGVDRIEYQLSGGVWTTYSGALTVGSQQTTVSYRAVDRAGNIERAREVTVPAAQSTLKTTLTTATPQSQTVSAGKTVTVKITVSGSGGRPNGLVRVSDGTRQLASGSLARGTAKVRMPARAIGVGQHTLAIDYDGDSTYAPSHTTALVMVTKQASSAAITLSPATGSYGSTFKVKVKVSASGLVPDGMVSISDGGSVVATGQLTGGKADITLPPLSVGTHPLSASYAGNDLIGPSTSFVKNVTVKQATATVTVSVPKLKANTPIPLSLTVRVKPSNVVATGTITATFNRGTATVTNGTATLANGSAGLLIDGVPAGTYTLTVTYGGDTNVSPASVQKTITVT